ncbi:tagaturonate reductase [Cohnella endophytica]|nr:tagaturonate reductase [Cohnella endophytica]
MKPEATASETLPLIGPDILQPDGLARFRRSGELPVKVLQFGEGNFLRGFADWMLETCNRKQLFNGAVAVTQPRPSGKTKLDQLKAQNGIYTLLVRGLREGQRLEEKETVTVLSRMIDPYGEWESFLELAEGPELEFVISNTTEAGIAYRHSEWNPREPVSSFPGKLTAFLYRRFERFSGDPGKGLIHLPCELIEQNGDRLLETVLRHADDWRLPDAFKSWVRESNRFLNTLVDRIVTGFPAEEAEGLFSEWGYADPLLVTSEPYYLWAIQAGRELEERLPLETAGLNVRWVDDLTPFRMRKVRILNGTHTLMATIGLMNGLREVREALEHPAWGPKFIQGLFDEILPGIPLDRGELLAYANETLERFRNPYIRHRLADIAMNGIAKWKVRLLPSVKAYIGATGKTPPILAESLASMIRLCLPEPHSESDDNQSQKGTPLQTRDDPLLLDLIRKTWQSPTTGDGDGAKDSARRILALTELWGEDLTELPGLADKVSGHFAKWEKSSR